MCCTSIPGSWAASSQSEAARRTVIKKKLRAFARSFFPVQRNTTRRTRPFFPQTKRRRQGGMPAKSAEPAARRFLSATGCGLFSDGAVPRAFSSLCTFPKRRPRSFPGRPSKFRRRRTTRSRPDIFCCPCMPSGSLPPPPTRGRRHSDRDRCSGR